MKINIKGIGDFSKLKGISMGMHNKDIYSPTVAAAMSPIMSPKKDISSSIARTRISHGRYLSNLNIPREMTTTVCNSATRADSMAKSRVDSNWKVQRQQNIWKNSRNRKGVVSFGESRATALSPIFVRTRKEKSNTKVCTDNVSNSINSLNDSNWCS